MDINNIDFYYCLFGLLAKNKPFSLTVSGNATSSSPRDAALFRNFFKNARFDLTDHIGGSTELCFFWGIQNTKSNQLLLERAVYNDSQIILVEDGFLRSADTWCNYSAPKKYTRGISFTFDSKAAYFDAHRSSLLEEMLNDDNINLSANELSRARTLIRKIVDNKLSKYNHQPIYTPEIGVKGRKKVLVIDQNATDMSVTMGGLDKNSFRSMLSDAVNENPNCDIIVKTHPDVLTGNVNGFFDHLHDRDNVYIFRAPINPICLLQYVDKVYVGTSQLGFEALMCGKETHVYGTPFYSNWGVTVDNVACARRTRKRSIEEIFYITYIIYSYYINPETEKHIEIEEAIDYLIKLRVEYSDYLQNGKKVCENIKSKQSAKDKIYKYISEHSDERIVFWGASTFLQDFFNDNKNIIPNVEAIVDADESKRSTRIHGIEIKPPEFIDNAGKITLISSLNNDHDIRFEAIKRYVFSSINARCINLLDDFFC